jgi:hypothetical protein
MESDLWLPATEFDIGDTQRPANGIAVYVPVDAVFPTCEASEPELRSVIRKLSRTDALFWAARLNLILSNPSYHDENKKQAYAIANFFSTDERRRLTAFAKKHDGACVAFFRGQLLELMRWICLECRDLPDDGTTFNDPEVRRNFAKAALIISDLWGRRTYDGKMVPNEAIDVARRRSLGAVRVAFDATTSGIDPLMAIGRGELLFSDHFTQIDPTFSTEFREKTGLTLEDYFAVLCLIAVHFLNRTPEDVVRSSSQSGLFRQDHFAQANKRLAAISGRYFDMATQTPDELAAALWSESKIARKVALEWQDFRAIRDRPILRVPDGRMVVLDPVFFAESAAIGPLFKVLSRGAKSSQSLLDRFGEAFESYATAVLHRMYPRSSGRLVNRLISPLLGKNQEGSTVEIADACLNDVTEAVLFECKATWIRDDLVEGRDGDAYRGALIERYSQLSDGTPKGVGQLARSIRAIEDGSWYATGEGLSSVSKFYPVLVVYDTRMEAMSHAHFLANEFREALQPDSILPDGDMQVGSFRVSPIVLLTVDILEILERSIDNFSLVELLRQYSRESPDRMTSLREFLARSTFGRKLFANSSLASSTVEVLQSAKELLWSVYYAQA